MILQKYINETDYFIIDSDDVDMIKEYTWHRNNARGGYITANKRKHIDGNYGTIQVARYIMNCPKDMVVDHINGNVSDNRKDNLRICTHEQNSHNLVRTNGKSGHIGVYWDKTRENTKNARYQSYIAVDGKRVRKNFKVSDYGTKENAYEHACKWQEEMSIESYGEFSIYLSRDNLLLDKQQ